MLRRVQSPTMGRTRLRAASTLQPQDVKLMLESAGAAFMSKSHLVPTLVCCHRSGRVPAQAGCRAPRVLLLCALLSLPVQQSKHWCGYAAAHLPNLLVNAQGAFLNVLHVGHNRFIN